MFAKFAKVMGTILGSSVAFTLACVLIIFWLISGRLFHFSDTWQLLINTTTNIITLLMVFILQNTQNRDTLAIQLKLDELIKVSQASNALLDVEELSDEDLRKLYARYEKLGKEEDPTQK